MSRIGERRVGLDPLGDPRIEHALVAPRCGFVHSTPSFISRPGRTRRSRTGPPVWFAPEPAGNTDARMIPLTGLQLVGPRRVGAGPLARDARRLARRTRRPGSAHPSTPGRWRAAAVRRPPRERGPAERVAGADRVDDVDLRHRHRTLLGRGEHSNITRTIGQQHRQSRRRRASARAASTASVSGAR